MSPIKSILCCGLGIEGIYLLYRLWPTGPSGTVLKYMVVYALVFIILAFAFFQVRRVDVSPRLLGMVLLLALVFQVTLVTTPPEMSDDIYRYIWDGKLQCGGINPFTFAPGDPALIAHHSEILPGLVNFPHIKTIYLPAAQMLFRFSYQVFGESVTGMKFLFVLFQLGCIFLFYLIMKRKGRPLPWLLIFAWNPLLIMETAVNGHLDVVMVFFLLLCLYFFYRNNSILSGITLALAILTKLIPLILAPLFFFFFLKGEKKLKRLAAFFTPLVLTIVALYLPYIETARNMFLTAFNYSSKWYFNNPLFHLFLTVTGDNGRAHLLAFSLFLLLYVVILFRPLALEEKIFLVFCAFVVCNPTIHPWYLTVLLGLLAIGPNLAVPIWSGLVVFSYLVVYEFKMTGVWQDAWLPMILQYLPLALLFILNRIKKIDLQKIISFTYHFPHNHKL